MLPIRPVDIHPKQREKMAELMLDLAKVLFASFVVGPFLITDKPFKFWLVVVGFLCSTVAVVFGLIFSRPKKEE